MHLSLDSYVTIAYGGTTIKWDNVVIRFCIDNLADVDTILLGRNTAQEFILFWDDVAGNPSHNDHDLGKRISEIPKAVFSTTLTTHKWDRTTIINGNFNDEIIKLKESAGKRHFGLW